MIDLLGPSLEDLFDNCSRKFSVKTVASLAHNMVKKKNYIFLKCTGANIPHCRSLEFNASMKII